MITEETLNKITSTPKETLALYACRLNTFQPVEELGILDARVGGYSTEVLLFIINIISYKEFLRCWNTVFQKLKTDEEFTIWWDTRSNPGINISIINPN